MPILIDGTNLLWSLHEAFDEREIATEVQLCWTLERYLALVEESGEVIFDGAGPTDQSAFGQLAHLEVVFSGFNCDADTVVEEKIKANTAPKRLTVVSSDRQLRKAAAARKAIALKSDAFWQTVLNQLQQGRPTPKEPAEKQQGLTPGEAQQWMDLFGLGD